MAGGEWPWEGVKRNVGVALVCLWTTATGERGAEAPAWEVSRTEVMDAGKVLLPAAVPAHAPAALKMGAGVRPADRSRAAH